MYVSRIRVRAVMVTSVRQSRHLLTYWFVDSESTSATLADLDLLALSMSSGMI